jgi:hypothetical protein
MPVVLPPRWSVTRELPRQFLRAAIFVIAIAGVVSAAIPGSPIRQWIEGILAGQPEPAAPEAVVQPPTTPVQEPPQAPAAGQAIFVNVEDGGRIFFSLVSPSPDIIVRIRLVDSDSASADYAEVVRSSRASDRITLRGLGAGEVVLSVPRKAAVAGVAVDGQTWWSKTGSEIQETGPNPSHPAEGEVIFRIRS